MENIIWYTFLTLYGAIGLLAGVGVTATTLKYWKYAMEAEKLKTHPRQVSIGRKVWMYATLPTNFLIYLLAWPAMAYWAVHRIRKAATQLGGITAEMPPGS